MLVFNLKKWVVCGMLYASLESEVFDRLIWKKKNNLIVYSTGEDLFPGHFGAPTLMNWISFFILDQWFPPIFRILIQC